jgi:ubiquinone/menaquinone biosynthesis C-methylase UbiE
MGHAMSISKVRALFKNAYFRLSIIIISILAIVHYISAGLPGIHLLSVFLGIAAIGGFCALHLGRRIGLFIGALFTLLVVADDIWVLGYTGPSEIVVELMAGLVCLILGVVVGGWADKRNINRPHPQMGSLYWDSVAQTTMGQYITLRELNFIAQFFSELHKKPEVILDVGAGPGRLEPMLSSFSSQVICTEVDPSLIKVLASKGRNVMPLLVSKETQTLPLADASVDVVICIELPGLAEQDWFYSECQRILKLGGVVITTITNRLSWKGTIAKFTQRSYTHVSGRYYEHTIREIKMSLRRHGFIVHRARGMNWLPFSRSSDSPLIRIFASLERIIQLDKLVSYSPWVILEIRKE